MKKIFLAALLLCAVTTAYSQKKKGEDHTINLQKANKEYVLEDSRYYTWGASPIKGKDGKYHLYYSRWDKRYGFLAWVTHSEVAHAVSDSPLGPYKFHDLALPARGDKFWDGMNTHNPTIHRFNEKYYLYYTGNRGDTLENKFALNVSHRNNQRIGVAVSSSPYGPWQRFDHPIIDVSEDSTAPDAKMTANPSVTKMKDGRYLMVYKAVGKKTKGIWGGPVVHLCAIADRPDGPFVKHLSPIFTSPGVEFPAEDPYVWLQDGTYYAIVKDMKGHFTHAGRSLALFYSDDGQIWQPTNDCLITTPEINWNDGTISPMKHLERPQLLFDDRNHPIALFLAADSMADYTKEEGTSFNVSIPIQGEKRLKMKGHLNERNVQSTPNH